MNEKTICRQGGIDIVETKGSFLTNFKFSRQGIISSFEERSTRICFLVVICTTIVGLILEISPIEWCAIVTMFALVISLEMINTAIEIIVDMISPEFNVAAGKVKDIAAGAVLIAMIASIIVGLIIFIPKIMALCA
ncbi:MAG: diacylglycerol kinase family protein [Candidatus Pacebacteria bacterium]|nr:diacylglycerol kinase family protein [Candidatus Paceibacterota bacterium]